MATRTRWRRQETARCLTQEALRGPRAGTLAAVGRALPVPRKEGTVGSYVTRTVCPDLIGLFEILTGAREWDAAVVMRGLQVFVGLNTSPETSARPMAEALLSAVEYRELAAAAGDLPKIEARARYLLEARHAWNAQESQAAEAGRDDFPDKLEREGFGQIELAPALRFLAAHGIYLIAAPERARRRA